MSNFLIALAVFLITVMGALFAVPYFIDWNGYRGVFEEEASRLLGREVRVGGAVNLHVLPTPYFRFEKVRIADASVNLQEPFFRADSLSVKLNVAPLFRGAIEANEIEFERPVLRLALNEDDGWNWQSFGAALANAAYLPTNVALASVRISNGVLALHAVDGSERTRFSGIDAELSAPALRGPYRLRGTVEAGGERREVRIATAEPDIDGAVRFKALLGAGTSTSYTLDGRLVDLMGKPHVNGELSARLPIGALLRDRTGPGQAPDAAGEGAVELRANVAAGAAGADLSDIALSFEQEGRPQLISGSLKASWRDALLIELNLSSPWLDIDHITAGSPAGPIASTMPLAWRLVSILPDARLRARLAVEQANLGGEAVSGMRLGLVRARHGLEIEELRLNMPGGSRGELTGVISGPTEAPQFAGQISVRGTSIVRFATWAAGSAVRLVAAGDGPFGARARLAISPGTAVASELVGELSATTIGGAVQYRWEGRREATVQLDAPQLDLRALLPPGSSLRDLASLGLEAPRAGLIVQEGTHDGAHGNSGRGTDLDVYLRLNAGELITAERTYRDVAAEVSWKGGAVKVPLFRMASDDGLQVELEGEVDDVAAAPKGALRASLAVDKPDGVAAAIALLGLGDYASADARAPAMVPLRLAGAVRFGKRAPGSADLSLAGEANGASVRISGRLDGSNGGWRTGPADLSALIEGADGGSVAALLLPGQSPARTEAAAPGRLLIAASGIPAQGLDALASLETGDLMLQFRGQLIAAAAGDLTATGDLDLKAADARRFAPLAGMATSSLRLEPVPLEGALKLALARGNVRVERMAVRVGASDVKGKLLLSSLGERQRIEAQFDFNEVTLAQLLTPVLDQRLAVAGAAEAAINGRESPWPDEPFAAGAFDGLEGNISLASGHLLLAPGLGLADARVELGLEPGRLEVRNIEGRGLGGRVTASLSCEKVTGGIDVRGKLGLIDGKLEAITADANAAGGAAGGVAGEIAFSGRGSSVRSLLSLLQGGGTLRLADATLLTLWPGAIARATDAALQAPADKAAESLRQALLTGLGAERLPLPKEIGLELADGQLRIKPMVIDTPQGRAAGSASLDVRTLSFESDWRLEPPAAAKPGQAPGIGVSYRGSVLSLGGRAPRIDSEALERELAVRRVERDVEELERLRRIDETRRREDAERLRRQLEQAPPPLPVAPATPAGRPARPG